MLLVLETLNLSHKIKFRKTEIEGSRFFIFIICLVLKYQYTKITLLQTSKSYI